MRYLSFLLICICLISCNGPTPLNLNTTPTLTDITPYSQDVLDTIPSLTPEPTVLTNPQPDTQLAEGTLGAFGLGVAETLDIGGRYYTRGDCVDYSCNITLWPDGAKVWVRREAVGLPAWTPPPIVKFVSFTPTPVPFCAQVNGFTACSYNQADAEQAARQKWLDSLPAQQLPDATAQPAQCTACP